MPDNIAGSRASGQARGAFERLGLPLTVALAYGVDIAYVALVGWLSRPRAEDARVPAPAP